MRGTPSNGGIATIRAVLFFDSVRDESQAIRASHFGPGRGGGEVSAYQTSPIKRKRRSNDEMDNLLQAARAIIDGYDDPISIRHLFYKLVGETRPELRGKA